MSNIFDHLAAVYRLAIGCSRPEAAGQRFCGRMTRTDREGSSDSLFVMMSFYSQMKGLFRVSGRFDPSPAADRVPTTVIRAITADDYDSCIGIYKDNEAKFFPNGYLKEFEQDLSSDAYLWLGVEEYGDLVAVGGIHLDTEDTGAAALAFGMVRPDKHGIGYGSALLVARIASLPPPDPVIRIVMSSLENSVGFYKRFGFVYVMRHLMEDGSELDSYYAKITRSSWETARAILKSRHVAFDPDAVLVPNNPLPD